MPPRPSRRPNRPPPNPTPRRPQSRHPRRRPSPAAPTQQEIRAQIDRHQRNAQAAFRRQDLATAISEWDKVLALDPNNDLARARRQEAIELDRRLKQLK